MEFETVIECEANDGTRNQFRYSVEESAEHGKVKWIFRVMPFDLNSVDWYELSIAIIDTRIGKVVMMNNQNMDKYKGKGISEKMIEESGNYLRVKIISSSNKSEHKSFEAEYRTPPATCIWERLKLKGKAEYDEGRDIYTFIG